MKIIFDRDIPERKFRKDRAYLVIAKSHETTVKTYTVLNDYKHPAIIFIKEAGNEILDAAALFHAPMKVEFEISEIETKIPPQLVQPFQSENKHFFNDLLQKRCWAITEFAIKLRAAGIEISKDDQQIAFQDTAKIHYVQAAMSALFLGVCNFFAGCADMQFRFRFDKHCKTNIHLLTLANTSYNRYHQTAKDVISLKILNDWKSDLMDNLYASLTKSSDFGMYIQKNNLQEDAEYDRACLRLSIHRIILAIESIFIEESVIVHKIPMNELNITWNQYCLIFETSENWYRFYLGHYD